MTFNEFIPGFALISGFLFIVTSMLVLGRKHTMAQIRVEQPEAKRIER